MTHQLVAAAAVNQGLLAPHTFMCTQEPSYRLYRHIEYIGNVIRRAALTPGSRVIVNVGPRWGKSELISRFAPAWYLTLFPDRRILLGCHNTRLARKYGGAVRDLLTERPGLGVPLKADTTDKSEWLTLAGGGMRSVGVGEGAMGFGGDLGIIDDPYGTWADSQSAVERANVYDWYKGTFSTRMEPGASLVILHHRMHPMDLTGQILASDEAARFRHICLPSLAMDNDPLGRAPGEPLDPDRYSREELEAKRTTLGVVFDAMHQQQPSAMAAGAAYSRFSLQPFPAGNVDSQVDIRPDLPVQISMDFNISPGMHCYLGQYDPIADVMTCVHEVFEPNLNVQGATAKIGKMLQGWGRTSAEVFGDVSGGQRSIGTGVTNYQLVQQGLSRCGVSGRHRVPGSAPRVVDSLNHLNYMFRDMNDQIRYRVHPRCTRLINDYRSVQLDGDGSIDKSDPDLTHGSDAERYRASAIKGGVVGLIPKGEMRVDW